MSPFFTEMLHAESATGPERVAHRRGQAEAVVGAVVDHADLLVAQRALHVVRDRRTLHGIVGQATEERLPAVLAERGVGGRRRGGDQAGLIEHGAGGLRLAGERRADEADRVLVVDDLRGDPGRLLRVTLGVERLQLHLAARVGGVVLVDGQLDAVLDVDAERGVGAVERARHGDRHRRAGGLAVAGGVGGRGALGRLDLPAVLVDLHLLDDLQIGRRRSPPSAPGTGCSRPCRAPSDLRYREQCAPCHATAHVSPPGQCFCRRRRSSFDRPGC